MTQTTPPAAEPRITRILVPFDFAEPSERALVYARELARRFGAALDLLHVIPNPYANLYIPLPPDVSSTLPRDFIEDLTRDAQARLDRVLTADERRERPATTVVKVGDARLEILDHAEREGVDLIVMGTHGRTGVSHLVLGSVAEKVVRSAPCPVLTVR